MTMASTKMKKRQRLSPSSSTSSLSSISSTSSSSTVTAAAAAAASSSPCSPSSSTSTSCSSSSPCCSCNAAINHHTPPPVAESHELELQVELEVEVEALPKSKRRKRTRSTKANAAAADRRIKKESKNKNDGEEEEKSIGTGGGSSLPLPPHPPGRRSSAFRGVTRHRWTGRFEAHLWDKSSWNNMHNKKGRQVYLGAYDDEEAAARTYDLAALKYWGPGTTLNFPVEGYEKEMEEMGKVTKEEYLASLRRRSSGFSRGVSKYRGVARHHHNGRWEARIGRVLGNKYLYLGTFNTQEEAAEAYDLAALEYRGANAVTNFDVANYVDRLKAKGLNVDQFIHPSPPPTTAPELEIDAVDAVQPPPASPSPPPPLPSLDEEEKEETEAGAEVAAMMMMMMPPPPPPPRGDSDSMIAIEELLDFEHDDGMSGWSMCLDYPENAAVATAGCAGLPELFDDAGGFQLDDIDYLVFDAEFLDGDGGGKDVVNDKKPLSDDDGSTTTSVSCN